MSDFLKKECDLKYFHDNKYLRKKCKKCGDFYWTLDKNSELCGDQPCVPFSFIGKSLGKKSFNLSDVRNSFLSFFEKNNHSRLYYPETGERCPVVARWRSDIYLTIASIADFQPHVTSGEVPPPANPLVISQPCIRLNDLEQVGISGRHLTTFEMMGHHAFNKNFNEIYFKEDTVRLCNEYFTNMIGIPIEKINYKEQLWFGGGNAGPCLEVLAGGLEIATLVFMNMVKDPEGSFEIKGSNYSHNPLNIVDTGYGLERIAWCTQGTQTIYDCVFPEIIKWIVKKSEDNSDMQSIYSLGDHSKCLSFMLGDGIVPSNVKAGYLARLIIRRSLRFFEKIKIDGSLKDIVFMQLDLLAKDFPSLIKRKKQIGEILDIETRRYHDIIKKGKNLVKKIILEKKIIDTNDLILLYDTHGMQPDIVKNIAKEEGVYIKIPKNFESMVAELHSYETDEKEIPNEETNLPSSEKLYYKDHYTKIFNAEVLWTNKTESGFEVVLDKTAFYPEGGGQPSDIGFLSNSGKKYRVNHVKKQDNAIIHEVNGSLNVGDKVFGEIDWENRYSLMRHHTGTHVVNGALRKLLGEHIWQAGSQLLPENARFDFAHYTSITNDQKKKIEELANDFVKKKLDVKKLVLDRNSAEKIYGFRLYQGGVPPGNCIRVLDIPGVDFEACGGTHLNNIGEIEKIKVIKIERIQDGVNRVIFAAGKMVDIYHKEEKEIYHNLINILKPFYEIKENLNISEELRKVTDVFSVTIDQLDKTFERFLKESKIKTHKNVKNLLDAANDLFSEWKKQQKNKKKVTNNDINNYIKSAEIVPGTDYKIITDKTNLDAFAVSGAIVKNSGYIVHIFDGKKLVSMASENIDIDLREIAPELGKILGGSGGGRRRMTQCGGPNIDKVDSALKTAKKLTKKKLLTN
jgi:alanyl-tRNA synthetase